MDDSQITGYFCLLAIPAAFGLYLWSQYLQHKAKAKAWDEYQTALDNLRQHPANPQAKQYTLDLGRKYSNLTRNKRGVTILDEVAILNDINAACAAASAPPEVRVQPLTRTVEERLARLLELKNRGLVSEGEYESQRERILWDL